MIKQEHKKAIVERLAVGDLIVLGSSQRLVRGITHADISSGKNQGQLLFYFAKLRRSGYPASYTCYERDMVEEKFNGLVKTEVDLAMTRTAALVQACIEIWIRTKSDVAREIITEEQSVGKVI